MDVMPSGIPRGSKIKIIAVGSDEAEAVTGMEIAPIRPG